MRKRKRNLLICTLRKNCGIHTYPFLSFLHAFPVVFEGIQYTALILMSQQTNTHSHTKITPLYTRLTCEVLHYDMAGLKKKAGLWVFAARGSKGEKTRPESGLHLHGDLASGIYNISEHLHTVRCAKTAPILRKKADTQTCQGLPSTETVLGLR